MINYNHTVVVFLLLSLGIFKLGSCTETVKCIQSEREALDSFKNGIIDFPDKLSSWVGEDCCQWKGVECDYVSGHVIKLNLSNPAGRCRRYDYARSDYNYDGKVTRTSSSCPACNQPRPKCCSYPMRSSLDGDVKASLSVDENASFSGKISPYLGNLSSLTYLNLEGNYDLSTKNLDWVSSLSSLEYLYMGKVKINHTKGDWLHAINMLPSLQELSLCSCQLEHFPSSLTFLNFSSLEVLDLSYNSFNTSIPQWLFNLTSLTKLDLTFSNQGGKILDSFGRLGNLQYLYLGGNRFYGSIPASIGYLSSLNELDLSYNQMNGTIPESFGQLSKLVNLYLLENSWDGVITEAQLMNLKRLEEFMLTTDKNQPLVFNVTYNWSPPFTLKSLHLESCTIGPKFPFWLQVQNGLTHVTLKNVGIIGTIPDEWFFMISPQLTHLDLSNNQIKGNLPHQLVFPIVTKLFLQSNLFSGPIPSNINGLMPNLQYLDLSGNSLTGGIPINITSLTRLGTLNLSRNHLTGNIPKNIGNLRWLETLDLSNNSLFGTIPESMSSLTSLAHLNLSFNNLTGRIPSGNQLQTLNDATIYKGNPSLCGSPLLTKCP